MKAPPRFYRNYLLSLLLMILAFNFVERWALGLVLQNIKTDLGLSDTQLGFLNGIAFALFYAVVGIPIARWSDRGNRVRIIAWTTAVWSVMVALCGRALNFTQFLLIRIGVGVGEAGCIPPAHSLIPDYFSRAERPRAMGIYMQGINLSFFIGYMLAGWLNQLYGWRLMFLGLGLPGLVFSGLAWFTLKEPRLERTRRQAADASIAQEGQPTTMEVIRALWANRTLRHLLYSFSLLYFFGYGVTQWQPAYIVRSFGLKSGELGTWLAIIYGTTGIVGTHLGGDWATRFAPQNERLQLEWMAIANGAFNGVVWAFTYFTHSAVMVFVYMALSTLGGTLMNGPLFATIQTLVPPHMRAMSITLVYLFANFVGMGLGPLAAGALSDALHPLFGEESLRWALLALCPGFLWGSWHMWIASKTVSADLQAVQQESSALDASAETPA